MPEKRISEPVWRKIAEKAERDLDRERKKERFRRLEELIANIPHRVNGDAVTNASIPITEIRILKEWLGKDQRRWSETDGGRMEIPVLDGEEDVYGWVSKLERFFRIREAGDEDKLQVPISVKEGKALSWFQWLENCNPG